MERNYLREKLKAKNCQQIEERIIKNALDIIIIKAVKENMLNGYEIKLLVRRKFGVSLSAGTIYPQIYALEKKDLLKCYEKRGTRCYSLTYKGQTMISAINVMQNRIRVLIRDIY